MFNVIVIYVNEERKRRTQTYLEHTGIHKDQIYYLEASVIENSKTFLDKKMIEISRESFNLN